MSFTRTSTKKNSVSQHICHGNYTNNSQNWPSIIILFSRGFSAQVILIAITTKRVCNAKSKLGKVSESLRCEGNKCNFVAVGTKLMGPWKYLAWVLSNGSKRWWNYVQQIITLYCCPRCIVYSIFTTCVFKLRCQYLENMKLCKIIIIIISSWL